MSRDEVQALMEHFDDQLAKLAENIDSRIEHHLAPVQEDVAELKYDLKAIKAAIKDTNQDLHLLENRLNRLETAA